jgi:hypothetical protein
MTGPKMRRVWAFVSVLMLALVASVTLPSHAWGSRLHHGRHIGKHQHHHHRLHHSSRTDFRRRHYHHHHRHHHHHSSFFLGLGFYGYPYPYDYPYDYPYYGTYTPGDHRRFPAFRLPGFFHYPGAMGKGEKEGSVKP